MGESGARQDGAAPTVPPGPGQLVVISGPSGVGKTTIARRLTERTGATLSVSMTTRPKTPSERDGVDYYFVDDASFRKAIEEDRLLEWARVFDHHYGTPREPVERQRAAGRDVILEIDVAGAVQVRRRCADALTLFVLPPDESALLERLRHRGRDPEHVIEKRFQRARAEMEAARRAGVYDHFVVNGDLETAIDEAERFVRQRRRAVGEGSA